MEIRNSYKKSLYDYYISINLINNLKCLHYYYDPTTLKLNLPFLVQKDINFPKLNLTLTRILYT